MPVLIDGRVVASDSQDWMAECEARQVLAWPHEKRTHFFAFATKLRGDDAAQALKARCNNLEPHYVLALPNRELRAAYLERVLNNQGQDASTDLERAVRALWANKKSLASAEKVGA